MGNGQEPSTKSQGKYFYKEEVGAKQGSYLIGCSLSGQGKATLAICDLFLNLEAFQAYEATKALKAPQSNNPLV